MFPAQGSACVVFDIDNANWGQRFESHSTAALDIYWELFNLRCYCVEKAEHKKKRFGKTKWLRGIILYSNSFAGLNFSSNTSWVNITQSYFEQPFPPLTCPFGINTLCDN